MFAFRLAVLAALLTFQGVNSISTTSDNPDVELVKAHVKALANSTWRQPSGYLKYPYLVPAGPYNQLWDWDSMFLGVATLPYGSAPYFAGAFTNFLAHVNLTTGDIGGCLTPTGSTGVIFHAKPILIQAAWLSAKHSGSPKDWVEFKSAMAALLRYWDTDRRDDSTGLYRWYSQMESGMDNLVTSQCASHYSPCWVGSDNRTLADTLVMVFLHREHTAYAKFLSVWGDTDAAEKHLAVADSIASAVNQYLWSSSDGLYNAYNTSTGTPITNRVFIMAFPLFGGIANASQAAAVVEQLSKSDMLTPFGVRSTSSDDLRYSNTNEIVPYSNWRGPSWVNANALLSYALADYGYHALATQIATSVVKVLADDLRRTNTWHECYNSAEGPDGGHGLAAPGFLSWNTLGASWLDNLAAGVNPFAL